ncbi:MAG: DsrH/TusB family sulfur metabolism protein [Pseudomonadota bacterium]|nr:DsrH/TusB family sulfur metabolism protein [Pseudomonadota bacterium]MEE2748758.1 DsrH/TusB family sulfur metabolism protein [Pseudomonadota bacterium]
MTIHMLFTTNQQTLSEASAMLKDKDTLLLVGNGCYLAGQVKHSSSFALSQDMTARGQTNTAIKLISDSEWVELVASSEQVISWLD